MAAIEWRTRRLKNQKVLLWGKLTLPCGHAIEDRAQVRADPREFSKGQAALERLIKDQAARHAKECK